MTVADLSAFLQTQEPNAIVVLYDLSAHVNVAVCRLGTGEVQPVELFCEESHGSMWFELAQDRPDSAGVRLAGVVLGSP